MTPSCYDVKEFGESLQDLSDWISSSNLIHVLTSLHFCIGWPLRQMLKSCLRSLGYRPVEKAWIVVVCNHYGSVVAEAAMSGKPILFLDSAHFFYPYIHPIGSQRARW